MANKQQKTGNIPGIGHARKSQCKGFKKDWRKGEPLILRNPVYQAKLLIMNRARNPEELKPLFKGPYAWAYLEALKALMPGATYRFLKKQGLQDLVDKVAITEG